jgi:hypothetical protein
LSSQPLTIATVINSVRALADRRVESLDGLEAWYREAAALKGTLESHPEISSLVPHFVWHYLDDADLRLKDSAYRASQEQQLLATLRTMEKGNAV